MKDEAEFADVFSTWGQLYVSDADSEQLEEELHAFPKRRSETVAECYKRLRELTRMLSALPRDAVVPTCASLTRYFKRAMPRDWKDECARSSITFNIMSQAVEYFKRMEQTERRQRRNYRGDRDDSDIEAVVRPVQLNVWLSGHRAPLVARVSSGCGRSYIDAEFVAGNESAGFSLASPGETIELVDGPVPVDGYATVKFQLMNLQYRTRITRTLAVVRDAKDDMVIGYDLLSVLGLTINFRDGIIEWHGGAEHARMSRARGDQ